MWLPIDLTALVIIALENAHQVDRIYSQLFTSFDLFQRILEGGSFVVTLIRIQCVNVDLMQG